MKLKKIAVAIALALSINGAMAANGVLQNEYIKAGVNELTGTLGSGGNTSPGLLYNNAGSSTWNTAYDYLTPGSPFEGFTVRIEDSSGTLIRSYTNNNAGNMRNITGAWVGTPNSSSATWAGSNSDLALQHTYSLPSGQKYIDINTRIEAYIAMPKLWFGRFIDPDAVAAAGDSSATDNVLGYGAISRNNVVFSEATVSRYALGLYSAQTNVKAGITGWSTNPKDYYANGTTGYGSYTANTYGTGDDTIGLGFLVSGVSIGDIVNFRYAYIFGPSAFGAADAAVAGGAGGGTPGTVPGGGTLTDVGSATSSASSAPATPTVTGTTTTNSVSSVVTNDLSRSVSVTHVVGDATVTRSGLESTSTQVTTDTTFTPKIRTTTTTPVTVTTYSDGTSTTTSGTPVVTQTDASTTSVQATTTTVTETIIPSSVMPVIIGSIAHHTASDNGSIQTIARETTTTTTTPMNRATRVQVVTDGTTTSDATTNALFNDVATSVANDSATGRIDQHKVLAKLNDGLDRALDMSAFRSDGIRTENGRMYINGGVSKTNASNGYSGKNNFFGVAGETNVDNDWTVGVQFNKVYTTLAGVDSNTNQDKTHFGLYSFYDISGAKLVTNLGYAYNNINSTRRIVDFGFSNGHNTKGGDLWLGNRLYSPDLEGFRPFVGVTVGRTNTNGYIENGSIQSARIVNGTSGNYIYGETGLRFDQQLGDFVVSSEVTFATDKFATADVSLAYNINKNSIVSITGARQASNTVSTNYASLNLNVKF